MYEVWGLLSGSCEIMSWYNLDQAGHAVVVLQVLVYSNSPVSQVCAYIFNIYRMSDIRFIPSAIYSRVALYIDFHEFIYDWWHTLLKVIYLAFLPAHTCWGRPSSLATFLAPPPNHQWLHLIQICRLELARYRRIWSQFNQANMSDT